MGEISPLTPYMKVLVYGSRGWIGGQFTNILNEIGGEFHCGSARPENFRDLEKEVASIRPTHVISLIGRTHGSIKGKTYPTIDYLEQEGKLVELLVRDFKKYKGYDINYKIVGKTIPLYPERGFFAHARTHRVHCFLYLNKWGETHCYALTKALATGIPIFYNNIGSFRERLGDKEWHFKNAESERAFPDLPGTIARFKICLDYIISRQGTGEFPSDISNTIEYRPFYDDLFEIPNPDSPSHIRVPIL